MNDKENPDSRKNVVGADLTVQDSQPAVKMQTRKIITKSVVWECFNKQMVKNTVKFVCSMDGYENLHSIN